MGVDSPACDGASGHSVDSRDCIFPRHQAALAIGSQHAIVHDVGRLAAGTHFLLVVQQGGLGYGLRRSCNRLHFVVVAIDDPSRTESPKREP